MYRLYVEKKPAFAQEAEALRSELRDLLGLKLERVRILNRYDAEAPELWRILGDPCVDDFPDRVPEGARVLAVEYLPGQYDQRADAAEQCAGLLLGRRLKVRTARVYLFYGPLSDEDFDAVKRHLINPVECREARLDPYDALSDPWPEPGEVPVLAGFRDLDGAGLEALIPRYGLAMSREDLLCCRAHFRGEGRDPTLTELRVLDTYWSDHCRHTTFLTALEGFECPDGRVRAAWERCLALREELGRGDRPVTLMELATLGARGLRARGQLPDLVESEEVNACTVRATVEVDGRPEPWLLLFKNETHNHPTEIEPFGGAATCIGGAIRDPLSGRGYVYQAMRVTGAADPRGGRTLPGKLPQRTITRKAAEGYSAYGNQIGVPTGLVDEVYHEGYAAKRLEVGAVVAAVPEGNVRREAPEPGDRVLLLGGRTGRDGCGGATGSSKAHDARSLETCGAEVQKGNAPEERKLQRLFRNPAFSRLVKRCNDFGAGGVSVAVGELAAGTPHGLDIDLDAVPLKYAGLDGTEIAISESQERMAVVVGAEDVERALALAAEEDVEATVTAAFSEGGRMTMSWRGRRIVDLPYPFIQSHGAPRRAAVRVSAQGVLRPRVPGDFASALRAAVSDLNAASRRGLAERFDSTVGANSVLLPFGGRRQRTPAQAMAAKIPLIRGETHACTLMAWGFDPFLSSASPYDGAYMAVVESLCRLVASGADWRGGRCWLSLQEYFGKPGEDPERWGPPAAALLGALTAQLDLGVAAIGGKDSMSGSFTLPDGGELDVPPTLIAFALGLGDDRRVLSPEFKRPGSRVVLLRPGREEAEPPSLRALLGFVQDLIAGGRVLAAATPTFGGAAAMVLRMALGNGLGFAFGELGLDVLFSPLRGDFILELAEGDLTPPEGLQCLELGRTQAAPEISRGGEVLSLEELEALYDGALEGVFPTRVDQGPLAELPPAGADLPVARPPVGVARPRFLIPVFPGTNCEYESVRAVERAGGEAELLIVRTRDPEAMGASVERFAGRMDGAQALLLPGGFSNGDEPDGSGKFIALFLRSGAARASVERLLARGGLICGICNGFQALVRTGLIPFGRILDPEALGEGSAALTFNAIGRHQSKLARVRILTNRSPWLRRAEVGGLYTVPVSHGEGRFVCGPELLRELAERGQIAAQYVDGEGRPTMDSRDNPNGSLAAVECVTSADGRVLGRMGHAERVGAGLYRNFPGVVGGMGMFEAALDFLRA